VSDPFVSQLESALLPAIGGSVVPSPLEALGMRRFLFFTGKGGVGKTTTAAATALALSRRGKRVLIAMCNTKERLSAVLGTRPIGEEIVECLPGVSAVNIQPGLALAEYGEMVLKVKAVANAVFGNEYIRAFLRAVPGLQEWSMLGKAWFHTTEQDSHGKNRFDVVLFDAPATGHGLDMLRVPKIILEVAPPGVLRRDAERAVSLFRDPTRTGIVVVTLPEEMPVTETVELTSAIRGELGMTVASLFVNAVLPPLFDAEAEASLASRRDLLRLRAAEDAASGHDAALVAGARRAVREQVQRESVRRLLAELPEPAVLLPHLLDDASTRKGTERLAAVLGAPHVAGRAT
jgi:anion-transporting  ArsA/GET3 family ATPase